MTQLYEKVLKSKYIISLELYNESKGPLAVKLSNADGDFIGQTFVKLDNISEEMEVYSNGELVLSKDELTTIQNKVAKLMDDDDSGSKNESNRWKSRVDLANDKLSIYTD